METRKSSSKPVIVLTELSRFIINNKKWRILNNKYRLRSILENEHIVLHSNREIISDNVNLNKPGITLRRKREETINLTDISAPNNGIVIHVLLFWFIGPMFWYKKQHLTNRAKWKLRGRRRIGGHHFITTYSVCVYVHSIVILNRICLSFAVRGQAFKSHSEWTDFDEIWYYKSLLKCIYRMIRWTAWTPFRIVRGGHNVCPDYHSVEIGCSFFKGKGGRSKNPITLLVPKLKCMELLHHCYPWTFVASC
jgi:hypothetical protein